MFFQNELLTKTQKETVEITKYLFNGYSVEDIAKILDVPISLVKDLKKALIIDDK